MMNYSGYSTFEAIGRLTQKQVGWLVSGLNWMNKQRERHTK